MPPSEASVRSCPDLRAESLQIRLGRAEILPDLDLTLRAGEVTALVGPNGSGKSTALRAFARLLRPSRGTVLLEGRDIAKASTRAVARELAILPQAPHAPPALTVRELVEHGRHPHQGPLGRSTAEDRDAVEWALRATGMTAHAERQVDTLSGGERQRAWIGMALAQRTGVLLLDEPTTYLDLRYQLEVLALVRRLNREHGITVGWVLHDLNHAAHYSDRIVMLRDGRILAEGEPSRVIRADVIRDVFGVDVTVIPHPATGAPTCLPSGGDAAGPETLLEPRKVLA